MAKFYTLGPLRQQEYEALVLGLRWVAGDLFGDGFPVKREERKFALSALRNLDPRIVTHETLQGEESHSGHTD